MQHVLTINGNIKKAEDITDLTIMQLIYITYNRTPLPYETTKSLTDILFSQKDKTIEQLKATIMAFYTQNKFEVTSVTQLNSTDIKVTLKVVNNEVELFV